MQVVPEKCFDAIHGQEHSGMVALNDHANDLGEDGLFRAVQSSNREGLSYGRMTL